MKITLDKIAQKACEYKDDITSFLFDLVNIRSESRNEKTIIHRIKEEMEKVGFDKVNIDAMGNILGYIGHGEHLIVLDANVDTKPIEENGDLYRDLLDEVELNNKSLHKAGLASSIYAGKVIKDLNLEDDFTLVVTGTVQKEECEGLCWQFIIEEDNLKPELVILTEPTNNQIYLGQLGKMFVKIIDDTNSMDEIIKEVTEWNLRKDVSFGSSKIDISEVYYKENTNIDYVIVDILLRKGETYQSVIDELNNISIIKDNKAKVVLADYEEISYTGLVYPCKREFPSWHLPLNSPIIDLIGETYKSIYKDSPVYREWKHPTNGASVMGKHNINCFGFGPGDQKRIDKVIKKSDLVNATIFYTTLPLMYLDMKKRTK